MKVLIIAATVLAVSAGPSMAHHSGAMFDRAKETVLKGTVKNFGWNNPHSWIHMEAPDSSGAAKEWAIEMTSPISLARGGWTRTTLKPGDKVSITVRPLKDGSPGGQFVSVTLADGKVLGQQP